MVMDMIKHSLSTQSNKFAISLHYLRKEVRNGVRDQTFHKLDYFFLMKLPDMSKVLRKLILLNFSNTEEKVLEMLLCSIMMQNIQILYGVLHSCSYFVWLWSKIGVGF